MIYWISILAVNGLLTYLIVSAVVQSAAEAMVARYAEKLSMIDAKAEQRYANLLRKLSFIRRQNSSLQGFAEQKKSIEIHQINGNEDMASALLREWPPIDDIEDWKPESE